MFVALLPKAVPDLLLWKNGAKTQNEGSVKKESTETETSIHIKDIQRLSWGCFHGLNLKSMHFR